MKDERVPRGCKSSMPPDPAVLTALESKRALTLTDFLLARINDDMPDGHDYWCSWNQSSESCDCPRRRLLADREAKRRLVDRHADWIYEEEHRGCSCADGGTCWLLRGLGIVYADHPDYREEWRP